MFRSSIIMLVLITLATSFVGCGPRANWDLAVSSTELAQASLQYKWQNTIPLDMGQDVVRVDQIDEMVYCLTNDNIVICFDTNTGEHKWSQSVFRDGMKVWNFSHANKIMLPEVLGSTNVILGPQGELKEKNVLIVTSVSSAAMFDRKDGSFLANIDFDRAELTGNTPAICDGERIFVGGLKGWVNCFELINGISPWRSYTVGPVSSRPALVGKNFYVADENGIVYAQSIMLDSTKRLWPKVPAARMDSGVVAGIAADSNGVYVGSLDYSVYAFHPTTGKKLWRYRCAGPIRQNLQLGENTVYARANGDALYALDAAGKEAAKWKMDNGMFVLAENNGLTYVLNRKNYMNIVKTDTGKPKISVPMTGIGLYVPNTDSEEIFVANKDGLVGCIELK